MEKWLQIDGAAAYVNWEKLDLSSVPSNALPCRLENLRERMSAAAINNLQLADQESADIFDLSRNYNYSEKPYRRLMEGLSIFLGLTLYTNYWFKKKYASI